MRTIGIIIICLLFALGGYFFGKKSHSNVLVSSDTIVVQKDTEIIKYKLKPYKEIQVDTIFEFMDDSTCNKEYLDLYNKYAKIKLYKDTFVIDSSVFITSLTISKNNLDSLKFNAHRKWTYQINNIYNEIPSKNIYINSSVSVGNISIGIDYNFNKYSLGIGYNSFNNSPFIKIGYKIY